MTDRRIDPFLLLDINLFPREVRAAIEDAVRAGGGKIVRCLPSGWGIAVRAPRGAHEVTLRLAKFEAMRTTEIDATWIWRSPKMSHWFFAEDDTPGATSMSAAPRVEAEEA